MWEISPSHIAKAKAVYSKDSAELRKHVYAPCAQGLPVASMELCVLLALGVQPVLARGK